MLPWYPDIPEYVVVVGEVGAREVLVVRFMMQWTVRVAERGGWGETAASEQEGG